MQIRQAKKETLQEVSGAILSREIKDYEHLSDVIYNNYLNFDLFADDYITFESEIIIELRKDPFLQDLLDHHSFV